MPTNTKVYSSSDPMAATNRTLSQLEILLQQLIQVQTRLATAVQNIHSVLVQMQASGRH